MLCHVCISLIGDRPLCTCLLKLYRVPNPLLSHMWMHRFIAARLRHSRVDFLCHVRGPKSPVPWQKAPCQSEEQETNFIKPRLFHPLLIQSNWRMPALKLERRWMGDACKVMTYAFRVKPDNQESGRESVHKKLVRWKWQREPDTLYSRHFL